jgi:hypothetical protein
VEIIPSGQGCAGARLFLSLLYSYAKGLGNNIPGINAHYCCGGLYAALAALYYHPELDVAWAKHISTNTQ